MNQSRSATPSPKRIKLEEPETTTQGDEPDEDIAEESDNACSICLQEVVDRTVIAKCSHEFCFECLLVWAEQSRRCPLCSQGIGDYLIHSIRSRYDYCKHFLPPLRKSPPPSRPVQSNAILRNTRQYARRRQRERVWGTQDKEQDESDKLERSIMMRRWIYQHDLYAKHVASNAFTKYRPYPTPAQFSASQELLSRTTTFLRRELQVWEGLDVEFLTTLIISLMKSIDIRSESAVKLISEFLDMDEGYIPGRRQTNAEHFAHEVYSYVRSPYKDLFVYDSVVQYDTPSGVPPSDVHYSHRWNGPSSSRVPHEPWPPARQSTRRERSRSSDRSNSWSPSGRRYTPPPRDEREASWSSNRQYVGQDTSRDHSHNVRQPHSCRVDPERMDSTPCSSRREPTNSRPPSPRTYSTDLKGKQKADGPMSPPKGTSDHEDSRDRELNLERTPPPIQADDASANHGANRAPTKFTRVPRNLSLLDSVKAHLAANLGSTTGTIVNATRQQDCQRSSTSSQHAAEQVAHSDSNSIPSLLLRMSGPFPSSTSSFATTPTASELPSGLAIPADREIADSQDATASDERLGQQSSTAEDASLSALEARARLLARLNREKRQAEVSTPSGYSAGPSGPAVLQEQAKEKEAKLRAKAQLRARLAAEKRLADSHK
ncbi:hypothetical protein NLJ89_g3434 [Agrocybe chaxingu]|uniref:RING-type E3 ubiquitin transferase n=1 Tax=Agrocybe chaxingu TaxID=84603 RepID=A0A9W8K4M6_9AGAR|nr:hypothetical protein NLJ89_g3434 [Agrocybe chaxingu]